MIYLDVTKTARARHASGLLRVNRRLQEELGSAATPVGWTASASSFQPSDWYLTAEVFAPAERPGFDPFLRERRSPCAAIFHDAIPLRLPHVTWPQSVARHPSYLKMLAQFDRVFAVSTASREELVEYWQWLQVEVRAVVEVLPLGADFVREPRLRREAGGTDPRILCVGILEPRKNQALLLDAAETLWQSGLSFQLDLVGRVNPHFGRPLLQRLRRLERRYPSLHYHGAAADEDLARLFAAARFTALPTLAEGCGLPLLESLWRGVPCIASDLPSIRENAVGGGCALVPPDDLPAWTDALRRAVQDQGWTATLTAEVRDRPLPRWADTAARLLRSLA